MAKIMSKSEFNSWLEKAFKSSGQWQSIDAIVDGVDIELKFYIDEDGVEIKEYRIYGNEIWPPKVYPGNVAEVLSKFKRNIDKELLKTEPSEEVAKLLKENNFIVSNKPMYSALPTASIYDEYQYRGTKTYINKDNPEYFIMILEKGFRVGQYKSGFFARFTNYSVDFDLKDLKEYLKNFSEGKYSSGGVISGNSSCEYFPLFSHS